MHDIVLSTSPCMSPLFACTHIVRVKNAGLNVGVARDVTVDHATRRGTPHQAKHAQRHKRHCCNVLVCTCKLQSKVKRVIASKLEIFIPIRPHEICSVLFWTIGPGRLGNRRAMPLAHKIKGRELIDEVGRARKIENAAMREVRPRFERNLHPTH